MSTENALFHKNAYVGWTHTNGNYYPPDFDPKALVPNRKVKEKAKKEGKDKFMSMNMRMMMPFSMCCDTCGDFMYIGTKFNSRIQKVEEETYLNLSVYRSFGFCKHCRAEFTFKTNPKDGNYVMENGGSRQYEAFADADAAEGQLKTQEEQDKEDAMAALEQKRVDMEREMQAHDDLDRIMSMNKRGNRDVHTLNSALDALFSEGKIGANTSEKLVAAGLELVDPRAMSPEDEELEDEVEAFKQMQEAARNEAAAGTSVETEAQASATETKPAMDSLFETGLKQQEEKRKRPAALVGAIIKKKAKTKAPQVEKQPPPEQEPEKEETAAVPNLGGLMGSYGSSSSEDD